MQKTEISLNKLVDESIYIIREALTRFKKPAVLWSTGKDSTAMLYLLKMASIDGKINIPVVHLDTERKFPEIYEFRNRIAKEWDLNLIVAKNQEAIKRGVCLERDGLFTCCTALKTETLKQVLRKYKFDALIMSIRRDEHDMRNLERFFSPRDNKFKWKIVRPKTKEELKSGDAPFVSEQRVEIFNLFQTDFGEDCSHVRVHPILSWIELDIWRFIKKYKIPTNPLYFSKNGKRYRSLGCMPCTNPIDSNAKNIDEIIEELKTTDIEERSGRSQDKENEEIFRRFRSAGYM